MDKGREVVLRGPLCFSNRYSLASPGSEPAALALDSRLSLLRLILEVSDGVSFEGYQVGLVDNAV